MSAQYFSSIAVVLAGVALLSGCAVGPDFHRPTPPAVDGYTAQPLTATSSTADVAGGEEQRFVKGMDIPQQWWALFKSPPLNALIEKSLKANPTIDAAKAALRQARENVSAQVGYYFPFIQGSGSASRAKDSGAISPVTSAGEEPYSLQTAQVSVGFVPDVFGGNRRQVESLTAQADFQRFQLEATYLTLTSNVVAAAIQEASLRSQISATLSIIKIETEMLDQLRRQFTLGYVAGLDVAAQEAALAQVQQTLPTLQKQLAQTRDLLAALAGRFPNEELEETFEFASLSLPEELPVSLPSKLVEQRPDVRAAEEQLHSASAQVGVTVAAMLPSITLSADLGSTASGIGKLFTPGTGFWALAGNLTQPIFQGGTLLHRKRAAEAGLDQAGAQYRITVIAAFQNVADTLHALQSDADALKAAAAFEQAAKRSLDLARRQFELGYVNYLSLLSAQQAYQQAVINLVQAEANRFADTAALFMALGGGWWNRSDVLAEVGK
ncbi:MAG TPA: histidine kinase [Nitrospiraceae bacterium]|jgi:NodT family efflux transporter outer membrane factor (OMF) lipoprotein|nr:histidine kinase [Nitrospiraceae bacterium]